VLITRIIGDCPKCKGKETFGNCDVFGHELLRGCEECDYRERYYLPKLKKDILYLDQFFFSHAFHGDNHQFVDAERKLKLAAHEQLLSAPFSSLHEEEAALYKDREELREFIRSTSRGHKFEAQYQVEKTQVHRAFGKWVKGESADYVLEQRDALDRDINNWEGYLTIEVRGFRHDPEIIRQSKLQSVEQLVAIFDDWRKDHTTFDQDVEAEHLAAARSYANAYIELVMSAGSGDFQAVAFPTPHANTMAGIMHMLGSDQDPDEQLKKAGDFLRSEHFKNTPSQHLSATMFAALKAQVKHGAYTNVEATKNRKLKGFFYDVHHIATYAPYCDAILIDKPMYALVTHPSVGLEKKYGVKVFSRTNWDEFLSWIDGLQSKKTPEHTKGLELIHVKSLGSSFSKMKLKK
jgi:hypothetical protein